MSKENQIVDYPDQFPKTNDVVEFRIGKPLSSDLVTAMGLTYVSVRFDGVVLRRSIELSFDRPIFTLYLENTIVHFADGQWYWWIDSEKGHFRIDLEMSVIS